MTEKEEAEELKREAPHREAAIQRSANRQLAKQVADPQVADPQVADPQVAAPQVAAPQVAAPQVAAPQVAATQPGVDQQVANRQVANSALEQVQTHLADVISTLSAMKVDLTGVKTDLGTVKSAIETKPSCNIVPWAVAAVIALLGVVLSIILMYAHPDNRVLTIGELDVPSWLAAAMICAVAPAVIAYQFLQAYTSFQAQETNALTKIATSHKGATDSLKEAAALVAEVKGHADRLKLADDLGIALGAAAGEAVAALKRSK